MCVHISSPLVPADISPGTSNVLPWAAPGLGWVIPSAKAQSLSQGKLRGPCCPVNLQCPCSAFPEHKAMSVDMWE